MAGKARTGKACCGWVWRGRAVWLGRHGWACRLGQAGHGMVRQDLAWQSWSGLARRGTVRSVWFGKVGKARQARRIEQAEKGYLVMGRELSAINTSRLYRKGRWEISRRRAYQFIDAAAFAEMCINIHISVPARESHIVGPGLVWQGFVGVVWRGRVRHGRLGGVVWRGRVRHGRLGAVRRDLAGWAGIVPAWLGIARQASSGLVRHGTARHGGVRYDVTGFGKTWQARRGTTALARGRTGTTRHSTAGSAWRGRIRLGLAGYGRLGAAWTGLGTARQGMAGGAR